MRVDTRAGSKELIAPLRSAGVTVETTILPAGDIEILGNGPFGPVCIGIEYKTIEDAVACMRNGRFANQRRAMRESFGLSFLLIEGRLRFDERGLMSVWRGKWFELPGKITYQEFAGWLNTMCLVSGVLLWRTEDKTESVAWLRALEIWWTAKDWEDHRAHLEWYEPPVPDNPFLPPSYAMRMAAVLPGIGPELAERVAERLGSIKKISCATEDDWCSIPGVGKKKAAAAMAAITKEGR